MSQAEGKATVLLLLLKGAPGHRWQRWPGAVVWVERRRAMHPEEGRSLAVAQGRRKALPLLLKEAPGHRRNDGRLVAWRERRRAMPPEAARIQRASPGGAGYSRDLRQVL